MGHGAMEKVASQGVGAGDRGKLIIFGLNLSHLSKNVQLAVLALGAIGCAVAFSYLQEKSFRVKDVKQVGGFIALLQTLTYAVCGMLEMWTMGDSRKGALKDYALLCTLTQGGMLFTNWSLEYLTYPTRVIFKSSKVIPVMLMGVLIMKRSYSAAQYTTALLLAAGIAVFTLGDKTPSFNPIGIAFITAGVVFDAITGNFEERMFFATKRCSQAEVVTFSSLFGAVLGAVLLMGTGELSTGLGVASEHPEVYHLTVMSASMGYASVTFVLLLIKHFGATVAEVVKSCRKVVTIVISFVVYSKPVNSGHVWGFTLFVLSIVGGVLLKFSSKNKKARKNSDVDTNAPATSGR